MLFHLNVLHIFIIICFIWLLLSVSDKLLQVHLQVYAGTQK